MMFRRIAEVASSLFQTAISPITEAAAAVHEAKDAWSTYPRNTAERRAIIVCNEGYAKVAKADRRDQLLKVSVRFERATPSGMPGGDELERLADLDEALLDALAAEGAVSVGHVTAGGARHFYYYAAAQNGCAAAAQRVAGQYGYAPDCAQEPDAEKRGYWQDLSPTPDERQTIRDLKVLANLRQHGDIASLPREVVHWAYFADAAAAQAFTDWVRENQYKIIVGAPSQTEKVGVKFSHVGTMGLDAISHHTIALNRKALELNGEYDGWETSVEG